MATDPFWANVIFFSPLTEEYDSYPQACRRTGKPIWASGTPVIDKTRALIDGSTKGCLNTSGSNGTLWSDDSNDWIIAASTYWCAEAFISFDATTGSQCIVSQWANIAPAWQFQYIAGTGLQFDWVNSGTTHTVSRSWTPSTGVWYHVVFERNASGVCRLYVDGVMLGANVTNNVASGNVSSSGLDIGRRAATTLNRFNGCISCLRITKGGSARYDSDAGFSALTELFYDNAESTNFIVPGYQNYAVMSPDDDKAMVAAYQTYAIMGTPGGFVYISGLQTYAILVQPSDVGRVLEVTDNGTWDGSPTSFNYQWQRDGVDIPGEIASTYTVVEDDIDCLITCDVEAVNAFGGTIEASNAITPLG